MCASYIEVGSKSLSNESLNISDENSSIEEKQEIGKIVYNGKLPMPIENFIKVSSKFGLREAHGVVHANHTGIDLCGTVGSKVMSVKEGEVTHAQDEDA